MHGPHPVPSPERAALSLKAAPGCRWAGYLLGLLWSSPAGTKKPGASVPQGYSSSTTSLISIYFWTFPDKALYRLWLHILDFPMCLPRWSLSPPLCLPSSPLHSSDQQGGGKREDRCRAWIEKGKEIGWNPVFRQREQRGLQSVPPKMPKAFLESVSSGPRLA